MTLVYDQRPDSSLAVYIDGDLQFDSRDEALYHELLALPALALLHHRKPRSRYRALICGGGDGLAARELLKDPAITHLDLVDYDPNILELARTIWPELNQHAFDDPRLHVHVEDAVQFVAERVRGHHEYDLIICDFTVPQDRDGARLHSVEWYATLRQLLAPHGLIAVNAASPSQTPLAYWSIYNSLRAAELFPRPYRFALPSFTALDYGDDWGFVIGGPQAIRSREFEGLQFVEPRSFITDAAQIQRCFVFPKAVAAHRAVAPPTAMGSEWLLQALFNPTWEDASGHDWDALDWGHDPALLPEIDRTTTLIPHSLQAVFEQELTEQAIFEQVIEVMPALRADQTRSMIREFIEQPGRFLASIDLRGIVDALLKRAAALPERLVAELRLLRTTLRRSWSNPHSLLHRGLRIVSVIALVIILSNLFHPDTAYGKGGSRSSGGSGAADGGVTGSQSFMRTSSPYDVVSAPPSTVSGRGFSPRYYGSGRGYTVDELGSYYPTRRYRYYGSYYRGSSYRSYRYGTTPPEDPNAGDALYRLTPETDLLANGEIVIALTDQAYLLLADEVTSVVDINTGLPILFLKRDPALIWRTKQELDRQKTGLKGSIQAKRDWMNWMSWLGFAPWRDDDEFELVNITDTVSVMDKALGSLGEVPASMPAVAAPPVAGALQLFTGVWVLSDGSMVVIERPDGRLGYLDRQGWWYDIGKTQPIEEPYPEDFRRLALLPYATKVVSDFNTTNTALSQELTSAQTDLSLLQKDKTDYESIQRSYGPSDMVEYGTSEIRVDEALRRTNQDIERTNQLIEVIKNQQTQLPLLHTATQLLVDRLK